MGKNRTVISTELSVCDIRPADEKSRNFFDKIARFLRNEKKVQLDNRIHSFPEIDVNALFISFSVHQTRKEFEEQGVWKFPTKCNEEGVYTVSMDLLKEAENHCVLQSPIPITCPVRLIHGLKDEDVPWHISLQVAERVLSNDVDVILRRQGQHRMTDKDDIKLMVYTIDDLIDKLTTMA